MLVEYDPFRFGDGSFRLFRLSGSIAQLLNGDPRNIDPSSIAYLGLATLAGQLELVGGIWGSHGICSRLGTCLWIDNVRSNYSWIYYQLAHHSSDAEVLERATF